MGYFRFAGLLSFDTFSIRTGRCRRGAPESVSQDSRRTANVIIVLMENDARPGGLLLGKV